MRPSTRRGLSAGHRAGRRLRRAGSGGHARQRAHLPPRRQPRAHHQRRRGVSRPRQPSTPRARSAGSPRTSRSPRSSASTPAHGFRRRSPDERLLTWDEAVDIVWGKAGMYPELKTPALYRDRGVDMVALFAQAVSRRGLEDDDADRGTGAAGPAVVRRADRPGPRPPPAGAPADVPPRQPEGGGAVARVGRQHQGDRDLCDRPRTREADRRGAPRDGALGARGAASP